MSDATLAGLKLLPYVILLVGVGIGFVFLVGSHVLPGWEFVIGALIGTWAHFVGAWALAAYTRSIGEA